MGFLANMTDRRPKIAESQDSRASKATLARLANDTDAKVRASMAANEGMDVSVLGHLAHDRDPRVREAAAANPNTPIAALLALSLDEVPQVAQQLRKNPTVGSDLAGFSRAHAQVITPARELLGRLPAETPTAPTSGKDAVSRRSSRIQDVLREGGATPEVLAVLAHYPDWALRKAVAETTDDSGLLDMLAMAEMDEVGMNPYTPSQTLEWLAAKLRDDRRSRRGIRSYFGGLIAENPNTPARALDSLAETKDSWVLERIARNPKASTQALSIAFEAMMSVVRPAGPGGRLSHEGLRSIGKHKNAPASALQAISAAGRPEWVVNNPNTPTPVLRAMANVSFEEDYSRATDICRGLAGNPSTPVEIIREKYREGYLAEVAANPCAPADLLSAFTEKALTELKKGETWRSVLFVDPFDVGRGHWDLTPLENVARNPNARPETLRMLWDFCHQELWVNEDWDGFVERRRDLQRILATNPRLPGKDNR